MMISNDSVSNYNVCKDATKVKIGRDLLRLAPAARETPDLVTCLPQL